MIFAFVGFVIAAEINPDEPSAVASCDDLANFASHRDFLLGSQRRHTPRALHGQQSRFLSIDCKEDDCSAASQKGAFPKPSTLTDLAHNSHTGISGSSRSQNRKKSSQLPVCRPCRTFVGTEFSLSCSPECLCPARVGGLTFVGATRPTREDAVRHKTINPAAGVPNFAPQGDP